MFSHSSSWIDQHDGNWIETKPWKAPKKRWSFKNWNFYSFLKCAFIFWPYHAAYGILVPWPCGILVPQLGIKPVPPALEAWSLNHWATRKVQEKVDLRKELREKGNEYVLSSLYQTLYVIYFLKSVQSSDAGTITCLYVTDRNSGTSRNDSFLPNVEQSESVRERMSCCLCQLKSSIFPRRNSRERWLSPIQ